MASDVLTASSEEGGVHLRRERYASDRSVAGSNHRPRRSPRLCFFRRYRELQVEHKKPLTRPSVNLRDVFDAWRKRADRVRSARFDWEEKSKSMPVASPIGPLPNAPAEAITVDHRVVLILDGDKVRYEMNGPAWSGIQNKIVDQEYRLVLDGSTEKSLFDTRRGAQIPSALSSIQLNEHNHKHFTIFRCFSIFAHSRCKSSKISIDLWRLGNSPSRLNDRPCIVMESLASKTYVQKLYVDAEKDCAVIRIEDLDGQRIVFEEDIEYEKNRDGEWVPSKWTGSLHGSRMGQVLEACSATMVRHRLNLPIRAEEFELTFPVGTAVTEMRGLAHAKDMSSCLARSVRIYVEWTQRQQAGHRNKDGNLPGRRCPALAPSEPAPPLLAQRVIYS